MHPTLRAVRRCETSEPLIFRPRCSSQLAGELRSRPHAELGVDVGQVAGDRPLRDEKRGGDLPIRTAFCDQGGDPPLGGREPFFAPAPADVSELAASLLDPRRCPERSKPSSAVWIASRASRFFRARLRTTPSPSSARAVPNGSPTSSCCATARSRREPARATSPSAAATRPRHRVAFANTHSGHPRGIGLPASTTRTASSIRPSSRSSSAWSAVHQRTLGSPHPSSAAAGRPYRTIPWPRPDLRSTEPRDRGLPCVARGVRGTARERA